MRFVINGKEVGQVWVRVKKNKIDQCVPKK